MCVERNTGRARGRPRSTQPQMLAVSAERVSDAAAAPAETDPMRALRADPGNRPDTVACHLRVALYAAISLAIFGLAWPYSEQSVAVSVNLAQQQGAATVIAAAARTLPCPLPAPASSQPGDLDGDGRPIGYPATLALRPRTDAVVGARTRTSQRDKFPRAPFVGACLPALPIADTCFHFARTAWPALGAQHVRSAPTRGPPLACLSDPRPAAVRRPSAARAVRAGRR